MAKQSRQFYLIGAIILINVVLIGFNLFLIKEKKSEYKRLSELRKSTEANQFNENSSKEFMNMDCPEIVANSVEGTNIALRHYAGNVIIIQFSRFYKEDLPNLVYLRNLADKYRTSGVFLLFIDTRGKHDNNSLLLALS